jgi:putative membrane protein
MIRIARCAVASLVVGVASCGGSDPPPKAPEPPPPAAMAEPVPPAPPPASPAPAPAAVEPLPAAPADAPPAAPTAASLGDDQILHVLHTANAGEIEQGKLAQQKAKNARVKRFAAMMVKDHTDADNKARDVAKKAKVSMTPSDVSKNLESEAKQMTSSMSSQKGTEFDRAYIDAQVKEHQAVLDLIDKQLLPNAKSEEVKSLLQTLRPKIEGHLKEAQDIQKNLGA